MNSKVELHLVVIFCLSIFLLTGCKKLKYPDHIVAGDASGRHIYHSGMGLVHHHKGNSGSWQWEIDINDDGTDDCILKYYASLGMGSQSMQISITPVSLPGCAIAADVATKFADTIPGNTIIHQNMEWLPNDCILYHYSHTSGQSATQYGLWQGKKGKYVGVRAMVDDHFIYGWLKIEIDGQELKFFEFAGTGY